MRLYSRLLLLVAAILSLATAAFAELNQPPAELAFLPSVLKVRDDWVAEHYVWDELQFPPMNGEQHPVKRGHYWRVWGDVEKAKNAIETWNFLKPVFLANGWTVVKEPEPGRSPGIGRYSRNGVDAWALIDFYNNRLQLKMVEVASPPFTLTLTPPTATQQKMASPDKGDFPYLVPLAGSKFRGGGRDPGPFWVTPKGGNQPEMVAQGSLHRGYALAGLSYALFLTEYRDALTKAGWEIVDESSSADAAMHAHFTKNGRNVWAFLHINGDGYDIAVADAGATDLAANLKKTCHVALYGVLFDFNKSTLQPASDAVLQQVADLLAKDNTLKVEVEGHTDNVGGDTYNQTLSEARARAVADWLTRHGVAAARLSSRGYGKTKPVADNNNDEGRAKNRRVEIADPACTPTPAKGT
ncbi:MAG TPA: OmpA family protein [Candidatus Angelobacter sp.]|jgi:outer membrane protein OmpA-like peptidoglycan-associated protein|nr:OmpA family protein [Candidatus Angelobacter sp.]